MKEPYIREYKYNFNSSWDSENLPALVVAYFDFLRPHSALEDKKVLAIFHQLKHITYMPDKCIALTF